MAFLSQLTGTMRTRERKNYLFELTLGEPPRDVKPVMTGWFHTNDSRIKLACDLEGTDPT
ncbi:hypothetical protein GCM10010911_19310 [Paenibacillus nasutitermitis]|uniref:Uncharacterized protein n=1 Tax=Paenibacillus nasutitermitis TaxID=1652958 RepID=A0A916YUW7_9BACL|nr:hypothetical protein GCM10010911_19310 [Paenibacillus nasutitermitis]